MGQLGIILVRHTGMYQIGHTSDPPAISLAGPSHVPFRPI